MASYRFTVNGNARTIDSSDRTRFRLSESYVSALTSMCAL
jgi:hypothetical protein